MVSPVVEFPPDFSFQRTRYCTSLATHGTVRGAGSRATPIVPPTSEQVVDRALPTRGWGLQCWVHWQGALCGSMRTGMLDHALQHGGTVNELPTRTSERIVQRLKIPSAIWCR